MIFITPATEHLTPDGLENYSPEALKLPDSLEIVVVEDLNGLFAPQTGNIQPQIATIPETLQVEIVNPPDRSEVAAVAYIDDWAEVIPPEVKTKSRKNPLSGE